MINKWDVGDVGDVGDKMNVWDWFGIRWFQNFEKNVERIEKTVERIEKKVDKIMATYAEAKQAWVDYTKSLQEENAALRAGLGEAQAAAQANADALAAFQADDAATDAQQLADAAQAVADDLTATLEGLKPAVVEPDPLPDEPHVDNTLPGDLPSK